MLSRVSDLTGVRVLSRMSVLTGVRVLSRMSVLTGVRVLSRVSDLTCVLFIPCLHAEVAACRLIRTVHVFPSLFDIRSLIVLSSGQENPPSCHLSSGTPAHGRLVTRCL